MDFIFSGTNLNKNQKKLQRFFEILPGLASWSILIGMTLLAFIKPLFAAVIIIAFYFYWLLKLIYLTLFLILSYCRLSFESQTNWMERIKGVDNIDSYLKSLEQEIKTKKKFKERQSLLIHKSELRELVSSEKGKPFSSDLHHLVIIPIATETKDVVEPGIIGLFSGTYPPGRIIVAIALEERASSEIKKGAHELVSAYKDKFFDMVIIEHPDGIAHEAKAKGANATFCARKMAEYFEEKKIKTENVISSCFDSDTVVDKTYFAALTYYFLICPTRLRASFQPVPVYNNNIWEAPGITRVLETGSSFFQLIEATNPEKLVTFSSHSMSFKALVDIGYWPCDMISDDSAIFWKAFIHYDGDYKVVPMYTTLSMGAVVADTWLKTVKNVYKQKRRWAWGVENFPIVMRAFLSEKKLPFLTKIKAGFKLFEGHIAWATWGFLLTIIGWLPAIFAGKEYAHSVFYYAEPRIAGTIFNLASFSLITSIVLSLLMLPKRKKGERHPILKRIGFAFQWLLVPLTIVFLSALPALDAQTRLMLGKYMTFWVTEKGKNKE